MVRWPQAHVQVGESHHDETHPGELHVAGVEGVTNFQKRYRIGCSENVRIRHAQVGGRRGTKGCTATGAGVQAQDDRPHGDPEAETGLLKRPDRVDRQDHVLKMRPK